MLPLPQQIHNLQTILQQQKLSQQNRHILKKEIQRLKQLIKKEKA